jgi:hypothetical protein
LSSGSKTKFLVLRFGGEQVLFSVRELPDGSLTLLFKQSKSGFGGEGLKDVLDLHTTIHSERNSGPNGRAAHKINYSLLTTAKDKYSGSLIVVKHKKRGFLWAAQSALTALVHDVPLKRSDKDAFVELVGYTHPTEILCYTIYGHSQDVTPPQIQGFSYSTHHFNALSLTVYGTFLHLPNYKLSITSSHMKLPMRKNDDFLGEERQLFVPTMSVNGIERFLQKTHSDLAAEYLKFLSLTANAKEVAELQSRSLENLFGRWPSLNDEVHEEYGVWSRHKNQIYSAPRFADGIAKPRDYQERRETIFVAQNTPEQLARFGLKSRYADADFTQK